MDYKLGQRIKNRRKELGMTQTDLANKLGLKSKASVSKVELGEDNLTTTTIQKYADALETTPAALMGLEVTDKRYANVDYMIKRGEEDAILLEKYHKLDADSQTIIKATMNALLQRKP